ncbi:Carboxylic ester hydrolase [Sergentomyia squamirostris]
MESTLFLLLALPMMTIGQGQASPVVCLEKDQCVTGTIMSGVSTKTFDAFYGIPYAKPPIGNLRFSNPQPAKKWSGILDGTVEKPMCIQKNVLVPNPTVTGDEDCLYLNVYRPRRENGSLYRKKLPVMVFIHYGGLFSGAITPYILGPEYFMDTGSVILVMMQYRLGALGFLTTGDSECPGNFGFKDQNLALRWVRDNIRCFGGDPNSVTLFGQSAGGVSTHLHMLSPLSKGLFHRAIVQSGNGIAPYNFPVDDPLDQARSQAEALDIPDAKKMNSSEIIERLRAVDAKTLVESSDRLKFFSVDPIVVFRTAVEPPGPGAFLTENPIKTVENGNFHHIPWMTGVVPNEGIVRAAAIITNETDLTELNRRFDELMPKLMQINATGQQLEDFWTKAKKYYFNGQSTVNDSNWERFDDIYSDRAFYHPFYKTVQAYVSYADVNANPIYLYKFAYKGDYSYSMAFTGTARDFGVGHCDDLIYLFRSPAIFPAGLPPNSIDDQMKNVLVKTYTNFARTGRPTDWSQVERCSKSTAQPMCSYQVYNKSSSGEIELSSSRDFDHHAVKLWDELREYW